MGVSFGDESHEFNFSKFSRNHHEKELPTVGGNDTYGITRIPTTVAGRGVVRRAGLVINTKIVYPGSGREDA